MRVNRKHLLNESGQSLVQALVGVGIIALMAATFAQMYVSQQKQLRSLEQKSEALDIKAQIITTMQNADACTCQLNPDLTTDDANDANLKFDSTIVDGSQEIKTNVLRTGCIAQAATIVTTNQTLGSGLEVESVALKNLKPTGVANVWTGEWSVTWKAKSFAATPLKAIKVAQKFIIDTTSPASTPNNRLIKSCIDTSERIKVASGQGALGTNPLGEITLDLEAHGFDPSGNDPDILVSQRDYNYDAVDGNTMDASYCGFTKISKLKFTVHCWASTNSSGGTERSSFDWIALQK
ncbi:MAG: hypothetical protein OM95_04295 [Bdellovibrio sp. ArHS]|uniref:hypothetical protein n=1 Tax=Bdellovibrio sp. ArHS TaxID=1569284 RepID=UPI0005836E3C|nr:hypothetical protein [Bdellovibrio sp. ArHS]KHD89350.1 MAG: hypothetical protein OM95_04295 [Bdellovibrio sp. ArHS]